MKSYNKEYQFQRFFGIDLSCRLKSSLQMPNVWALITWTFDEIFQRKRVMMKHMWSFYATVTKHPVGTSEISD